MSSHSFRVPRFQFFYDTKVLFIALTKLAFARMNSIDRTPEFLSKMKLLFNRQHAHLVSSYRMGLYFTLKSLNLKPGDEVLLSPITVADTINSIKLAGLKPVFVDMDLDSHCLCTDDLKRKVTAQSKVLLVTYLSGLVPEISDLLLFAKDHELILIEDISQNMDANYGKDKVGSHGHVSIASLSCGKNISTLYGGLILSDDVKLVEKIKSESNQFKSLGKKSVLSYYLLNCIKVQIATSKIIFPILVFPLLRFISFITNKCPVDFNHDPMKTKNIFRSQNPVLRSSFPSEFYAPVNSWQISLTDHQLGGLAKGTNRRRQLAKVLLENLSPQALSFVPRHLLKTDENSYYHFPIYCGKQKSSLRRHLFAGGIDNGSYGLNLCSEEKVFDIKIHLPNAWTIKHDSLFLPLHEDHSIEQMKYMASIVNIFFAHSSDLRR